MSTFSLWNGPGGGSAEIPAWYAQKLDNILNQLTALSDKVDDNHLHPATSWSTDKLYVSTEAQLPGLTADKSGGHNNGYIRITDLLVTGAIEINQQIKAHAGLLSDAPIQATNINATQDITATRDITAERDVIAKRNLLAQVNATIQGLLTAKQNLLVEGDAEIRGDTELQGDLVIEGDTELQGDVDIQQPLTTASIDLAHTWTAHLPAAFNSRNDDKIIPIAKLKYKDLGGGKFIVKPAIIFAYQTNGPTIDASNIKFSAQVTAGDSNSGQAQTGYGAFTVTYTKASNISNLRFGIYSETSSDHAGNDYYFAIKYNETSPVAGVTFEVAGINCSKPADQLNQMSSVIEEQATDDVTAGVILTNISSGSFVAWKVVDKAGHTYLTVDETESPVKREVLLGYVDTDHNGLKAHKLVLLTNDRVIVRDKEGHNESVAYLSDVTRGIIWQTAVRISTADMTELNALGTSFPISNNPNIPPAPFMDEDLALVRHYPAGDSETPALLKYRASSGTWDFVQQYPKPANSLAYQWFGYRKEDDHDTFYGHSFIVWQPDDAPPLDWSYIDLPLEEYRTIEEQDAIDQKINAAAITVPDWLETHQTKDFGFGISPNPAFIANKPVTGLAVLDGGTYDDSGTTNATIYQYVVDAGIYDVDATNPVHNAITQGFVSNYTNAIMKTMSGTTTPVSDPNTPNVLKWDTVGHKLWMDSGDGNNVYLLATAGFDPDEYVKKVSSTTQVLQTNVAFYAPANSGASGFGIKYDDGSGGSAAQRNLIRLNRIGGSQPDTIDVGDVYYALKVYGRVDAKAQYGASPNMKPADGRILYASFDENNQPRETDALAQMNKDIEPIYVALNDAISNVTAI